MITDTAKEIGLHIIPTEAKSLFQNLVCAVHCYVCLLNDARNVERDYVKAATELIEDYKVPYYKVLVIVTSS